MTDTIKDLQELTEIAREWRNLSKEINGWLIEEYNVDGMNVRCYFATGSNHTSVDFTISGKTICIGFFSPVQYELNNISCLENIRNFIDSARNAYVKTKEQQTDETKRQHEEQKKSRIKLLKIELERLEDKK